MLDIFKLRLDKVLDLLCSDLWRMHLAGNFGDIGRAASVPCKDLVTISDSRPYNVV